ncbi:MAG: hypothetical protein E6J72_14235, partial [Deltaproteobacteria bacterium]
SGVGKTRDELARALAAGILMFNVESPAELDALDRVAAAENRRAPIAIRVNPDVDPKTHPYISTGLKKSKFGIDIGAALEVYDRARRLPHLDVIGVDCHIGSQLTSLAPFEDALARIRGLVADVVGPICETGDFLARDRELLRVEPGDLLAVMSAGAYSSATPGCCSRASCT